MIECRGLTKSFTRGGTPHTALHPLDLVVPAGEIHALLGPNGAGKTTLCRLLSSVVAPTAGTALVAGHDVVRDTDAAKRSLGVVFGGDRGLYGHLSALQNLEFWGGLYGLSGRRVRSRAVALLERFGLGDRADDRVDDFSRGMKQRLHLARGMLHEPTVLLLDEPTVGLDPVASREFRAVVRELRESAGTTILVTSHDMQEAAAVADAFTLFDQGRVLAAARMADFRDTVPLPGKLRLGEPPSDRLAARITALDGVRWAAPGAGGRDVLYDLDSKAALLSALLDEGVARFELTDPTLEDVYLSMVGERGFRV